MEGEGSVGEDHPLEGIQRGSTHDSSSIIELSPAPALIRAFYFFISTNRNEKERVLPDVVYRGEVQPAKTV